MSSVKVPEHEGEGLVDGIDKRGDHGTEHHNSGHRTEPVIPRTVLSVVLTSSSPINDELEGIAPPPNYVSGTDIRVLEGNKAIASTYTPPHNDNVNNHRIQQHQRDQHINQGISKDVRRSRQVGYVQQLGHEHGTPKSK